MTTTSDQPAAEPTRPGPRIPTAITPPTTPVTTRSEEVLRAALVLVVIVLAIASQRRGHSWGDDFALYLDQARSLWRGDAYEVIEDNRFNVLNAATPTFSPYGYPWVWPIVLSPFVAILGLDLDRLAAVEVALLALVVVALHRLVRRRAGVIVAFLISAIVGLSPSILEHTDKLLSEFPHLLAVLLTLLWLDRIAFKHDTADKPDDEQNDESHDGAPTAAATLASGWSSASTRDLVVLGLLAAVAFNIRREGMVLIPAIAAAQIVVRAPWRRAVVPHVTFVGIVAIFQLLLPTALLARYPGEGFSHASAALGQWLPASIAEHLSFGADGASLAGWLLIGALAGGLLRMVLHARSDVALLVVPLLTIALFARFPFGHDPRYYIQVLPFALYFLAQFPRTVSELLQRGEVARRVATSLAATALVALLVIQIWHLPSQVRAARDFDRAGLVQFGPDDPTVQSVLEAVDRYTPPDAIVAFMKARTMTLYTDRRAVQSSDLDIVLRRATWFAMLRDSDFSQPLISDDEADQLQLTRVWEDDRWILWRLP